MGKKLGHDAVELGSFRGEPVGAVLLQLVGHVPACDKHAAAVQGAGGLGNGSAQEAVVGLGKPREPHAHHGHRAQVDGLFQEMERHEGGVVDVGHGRRGTGRGNAPAVQARGHVLGEGKVGAGRHALVRLPEGGQRASFLRRVGDEEPVAVERRVGRGDDDKVGSVGGHASGDLAVGGDGIGDGRLLAAPDGGHDERRMGHGVGGEQGHGVTFLFRESAWRAECRCGCLRESSRDNGSCIHDDPPRPYSPPNCQSVTGLYSPSSNERATIGRTATTKTSRRRCCRSAWPQ